MEIFLTIYWFIFGICLGSFFHVIGYRLPKGESILKPKHSYCPNCNHRLSLKDLIPIFSFLFSKGKCRYCKHKISIFYPFIEIVTGLLFAVSFHVFGFSYDFLIALVLSSLLSIILVSDTLYLIIPDEVIITGVILIFIIKFIALGWTSALLSLCYGLIMFVFMYLVMLAGNFIFKKESLGGADIKLMFLSGLTLDVFMSFCVIFISSVIALPTAMYLNIKQKEKMIPYGPFIMLAILILFVLKIDIDTILTWIS